MRRVHVTVSPIDAATGKPIDADALARDAPVVKAFSERYGEFLQALAHDDDLALITRVCAFNEMYLRQAMDARSAQPWSQRKWRGTSLHSRVQMALEMELLPDYIGPLLKAIASLRNKVVHDNPYQGAISELDVAELIEALPPANIIDPARGIHEQLLKLPVFAELRPHQRDLRFALLMAYVACLGASQSVSHLAKSNE